METADINTLVAIHDNEDAKLTTITESVGDISKYVTLQRMQRLMNKQLVYCKSDSTKSRRYYLTDIGKDLISDSIKEVVGRVAGQRVHTNSTSYEPYVPSADRAYYRNNGNKHIKSRGF